MMLVDTDTGVITEETPEVPESGSSFCVKCHGYYANLLHLANVMEARGFGLPHEIKLVADIKAWRKEHRAAFHNGVPVGAAA